MLRELRFDRCARQIAGAAPVAAAAAADEARHVADAPARVDLRACVGLGIGDEEIFVADGRVAFDRRARIGPVVLTHRTAGLLVTALEPEPQSSRAEQKDDPDDRVLEVAAARARRRDRFGRQWASLPEKPTRV